MRRVSRLNLANKNFTCFVDFFQPRCDFFVQTVIDEFVILCRSIIFSGIVRRCRGAGGIFGNFWIWRICWWWDRGLWGHHRWRAVAVFTYAHVRHGDENLVLSACKNISFSTIIKTRKSLSKHYIYTFSTISLVKSQYNSADLFVPLCFDVKILNLRICLKNSGNHNGIQLKPKLKRYLTLKHFGFQHFPRFSACFDPQHSPRGQSGRQLRRRTLFNHRPPCCKLFSSFFPGIT